MAQWTDLFRLFSYSFKSDPLEQDREKFITGAGITQPDAIPDLRYDSNINAGKGIMPLRDSNEFIDMSTVTNRQSRLKEYERLRNVPEIESAMTVIADEACVAGNTKVATPTLGFVNMEWLANNKTNERFLVYCWDFEKEDFTLGWAYNPRFVKEESTIRIIFSDGNSLVCTPDHLVLKRDQNWIQAGELQEDDKVMAFYRTSVKNSAKAHLFPRIYTHNLGWINEKQFIKDWRSKKPPTERIQELNKICRLMTSGATIEEASKVVGKYRELSTYYLKEYGWTPKELRELGKKPDYHQVISVHSYKKEKVYDLSVELHRNFCTNWGVVHNCQKGDNGQVFEVITENEEVKEELEFMYFHRKMLNLDQKKIWTMMKHSCINGDWFGEVIINPESPKDGILKLTPLPADSMYRLETTQGRLVEFQQSKEGPDYQSLSRVDVSQATETELMQATAIRFRPEQIIHIKIGDDRKTFYPYGVSLIEPARGPAHLLRMQEDAMVTYRISRASERRVFYIDVGQLAPYRAEAFLERLKDQFKKKKVARTRTSLPGASQVEERFHVPAIDEDIWVPIRPNTNTRIETLPGACLALNTKIPLIDGRTLTLEECIKEFQQGKQLWVYSVNPKNGDIVPGKVSWAGITRKNTEVFKVVFDNGKILICTPDHKFPILGKDFIEAKNLTVNQELIPFKMEKGIRVSAVKKLSPRMDVGTLTIDANHDIHNYHTFAISANVFVKNSNLDQIADVSYFRDKVYIAMNFPKNYFNSEDPNVSKMSLSTQNVKFARMIERLQSHIEDGLWEIADRHLKLIGFPEEAYKDLKIRMTPPSEWRELSRAEILNNRINMAGQLKGSQLMADFDICTKFLHYGEEETREMLGRLKIQKLDDLKMQIIAQNPTPLGVGMPGKEEQEVGAEPGGPNPMLGGGPGMPPPGGEMHLKTELNPTGNPIPEPTQEDILKFNLDIRDYTKDMDHEDIDFSNSG